MSAAPVEADGGDGLLRNMSAPPWMEICIRPLGRAGGSEGIGRSRLFCWIDFDAFDHPTAGDSRSRLEKLVALAESSAGVARAAPEKLRDLPEEELLDRMVRAAFLLEPADLGLPPLAIVRAMPSAPTGLAPIASAALVVTLLTRLSGTFFIARRSPHPPDFETLSPLAFFRALGS